ncbi:DUF1350 family protein [Cyanobium sp. WAJ14-Wanaka]|uniref:DUF1350 family protein n=1 Tax=Cyanobium sp. WAJ14-Wanaka TaxID=2823725 RepID=UPI0020CF28DD|nr:DUF1350 family protein [Cyanobium sp. WAJ14-Wanaka]MCP9774665.1 DUF1350 family protein [Cyanobium sp. WAJ14-Wanaka]
MGRWRQQGDIWLLEPSLGSAMGTIEFIGGSYLAAKPQLSYRRMLEALGEQGWRLAAWSYVPGFDHQAQANQAWRQFRQLKATGYHRDPQQPLMRLGHSLGCKLHLLAPDGGRGCSGLAALSFNNFSAERSVPLLAEMGQQFGFRSEFSPSPAETLEQVAQHYGQARNLLVRFSKDSIDQSMGLLEVLQSRPNDQSTLKTLAGDHLTPASAGLRQNLLGSWADDPKRQAVINELCQLIRGWSS